MLLRVAKARLDVLLRLSRFASSGHDRRAGELFVAGVVGASGRCRESQEPYSGTLKRQRFGGWVGVARKESREARREVKRIAKSETGESEEHGDGASSGASVSESLREKIASGARLRADTHDDLSCEEVECDEETPGMLVSVSSMFPNWP